MAHLRDVLVRRQGSLRVLVSHVTFRHASCLSVCQLTKGDFMRQSIPVLALFMLALGCGDSAVTLDSKTVKPDGAAVALDGKMKPELGVNRDGGAMAACPSTMKAGDTCAQASGWSCGMFGHGGCSDFKSCTCVGAVIACQTATAKTACEAGLLSDLTCYVEGNPNCDDPPTGGQCKCTGATWACGYTCPDGCPTTSRPPDGTTCSFAANLVCPYSGSTYCQCQKSKVVCCSTSTGCP